MFMEVEKSHNPPSADWRTRKAGGTIQLKAEGLRPRSPDVQGQERMQSELALPSLRVLWALSRLDDAHWRGPPALPGPPIRMLISSRNTLPDMPQKCCTATWASLSPVKLTHKLAWNCAPIPLEVNPTSPS